MCSIIASFDKEKMKQLVELNSYRGTHSHSLFVFDKLNGNAIFGHKDFGPLDMSEHEIPEGYIVAHQQAPTTDNKDESSVHPARLGNVDTLLWHNGIIKEKEVKRLQTHLKSNSTWDTELLLQYLQYYERPDNIDGTFSCVWWKSNKLFVFRNEISPLFIDKDLNISSTKFDGSESLAPNRMYEIFTAFEQGTKDIGIELVRTFETKENPYYFGDEN